MKMNASAETVKGYLETLPEERKEAVEKLREIILSHLPEGFEETVSYGMIGYVVPLATYPDGISCSEGGTSSLHEPGFPEKPRCAVPYGALCEASSGRMVQRRI